MTGPCEQCFELRTLSRASDDRMLCAECRGYKPGDRWIDTKTGRLYVLLDNWRWDSGGYDIPGEVVLLLKAVVGRQELDWGEGIADIRKRASDILDAHWIQGP